MNVTTANSPVAVKRIASPKTLAVADKVTNNRSKSVPEAPSVVVEYGYLSIDTTPWSLVSSNGKSLGQTPLLGVKLPVGAHILTLRNPDLGIETQYSVTIVAGKTLARRIGLQ